MIADEPVELVLAGGKLTLSPPFVRRFPAGHEHAGQVVGRKSSCSRCDREFAQFELNAAWLAALSERSREAYLRSCEVDAGRVWQPARCPTCERRALDQSAPIHTLEGKHESE